MKNKNNLDLKTVASLLGTRVRKTKVAGEYVKFNLTHIKGEIYPDESGGQYFKPKELGLYCYISDGTILDQIEIVENRIKAYESLKSDLVRIKKAVLKARPKIPERKSKC